ncbi:MAG: transposase [Candidatus Tectomicrobia bacterium]|nr:transposase [Candidatus Tectomicrobia bacterium]
MLVTKAHKILLYTTPETEAAFVSWCGAARWAYNLGLERKKAACEDTKKSPGSYAFMKEVVALKKTDEYAWLNDVPKSIPRMALRQLETAYANFFRRVKGGEKQKGFPKFKSKKRAKVAFHLEPDAISVKGNRVRIPKVGWIKMHDSIRFDGELVGTVCISCTASQWYASFSVETKIPDPIENQEKVVVGLDVGIKTLATLSDGKKFENPRAFYHLEKLLARAQLQVAHKQKGSKRWQQATLRVQRIHKRIADLRAIATHHASAYVAKHYHGVAIEDLNVKGMAKNHCLAKSVLDANMAELHRQLSYKMAWTGGEVRQVDRFFPSSKLCHICGCINHSLILADREWTCECGTHHDRDVNAATNLAIKCFGPMVSGPWTLRVKCSETPDEVSSEIISQRSKKGDLHSLRFGQVV